MSDHMLLGDLSGKGYVKLALAAPHKRHAFSTRYVCQSLDNLRDAMTDFLRAQDNPELIGAAFAACGWESDGGCAMPNHGYRVQRDWLRDVLSTRRLHLVNDCVCEAMAIPTLRPNELVKVCGGDGDDSQCQAFIGPNEGLGTVAMAPDDFGHVTVLPCEGGHSDLPAVNKREFEIIDVLRAKYTHVSRERAVSLPGLADIWQSLGIIDGGGAETLAPKDIVARATAGDPRALEAIRQCVHWLAATAADVALMTGARGGVYISGDLLDLLGDQFNKDDFAERFYDKGRLTEYLRDIPVHLVTAVEPKIIGLETLFAA